MLDRNQYDAWYQRSINDPTGFWAEHAIQLIDWMTPWQSVVTGEWSQGHIQWFTGGVLNAAYNCLDRHLPARAHQPAIIWEGDMSGESRTLTYQVVYDTVCRFANALRSLGVRKGTRVCIYLPMIPEAVIAMLACARIGAIHSVVFGGFSAEALKTRIQDATCECVITANEGLRGQKAIPLKRQVDDALTACPFVKSVVVVQRTDKEVVMTAGRDYWYHDITAAASEVCPPEPMQATDPLFILYTSGSTGQPKGIQHATGGYLVYAAMTHRYVFNYQEGDIYWCTADVGWITGHTYGVYGPMANGAISVIYEGVPHYPTPSRYWEIVDKYTVNIFYTAPTAIRALRREGDTWVQKTNRSSLRLLGSVGEPLNPEAWEWYHQIVGEGRCPIVDTWWQTETGGIMLTPLPHATPLKAGSVAWPFFGVLPAIVNDAGQRIQPGGGMGRLIIQQPWPGLAQTIFKNPERFVETYFKEVPGVYLTGDQAYQDEEGYYWIAGRSDDVIKVSGHRIGTQEVESALVAHPAVSEAAVVGIPDAIKGQVIYAFVALKVGFSPSDQLRSELVAKVREMIGPIAAPETIQWAAALPKTRSGKIMRRILRKIAMQDTADFGDLSTLADPDVVQALIQAPTTSLDNK